MNSLQNLIKLLDSNQVPFIFDSPIDSNQSSNESNHGNLSCSLEESLKTILKELKMIYKWSDEEMNLLEIGPIGRKYSLYKSFLCLIYQKYNSINNDTKKMK